MLDKIIKWGVEQYYRATLTLLIISNLLIVFKVTSLIMVPVIVFVGWMSGYVLDRYARYPHHLTSNMNKRNPELQEILERVKRIEAKQNESI